MTEITEGYKFSAHPADFISFAAKSTEVHISKEEAGLWSIGFVQTVRNLKRSFTFTDVIDGSESHYDHTITTILPSPFNDRNEKSKCPWYSNHAFKERLPAGTTVETLFLADRPGMDANLRNRLTEASMSNGVLREMSGRDEFNTSLVMLGPEGEVHVLYHWNWEVDYSSRKATLTSSGHGGERAVIVLSGERAGVIVNNETKETWPVNPNAFMESSGEQGAYDSDPESYDSGEEYGARYYETVDSYLRHAILALAHPDNEKPATNDPLWRPTGRAIVLNVFGSKYLFPPVGCDLESEQADPLDVMVYDETAWALCVSDAAGQIKWLTGIVIGDTGLVDTSHAAEAQ
ncbi:hypothetical protein [Streptomyces sp. NPDC126514]|uniref:hypothetical protein n=1 Tax=Streptomyces sp. NPDC126514 TaxID=3155210 RepID=UPI00332ADDAE